MAGGSLGFEGGRNNMFLFESPKKSKHTRIIKHFFDIFPDFTILRKFKAKILFFLRNYSLDSPTREHLPQDIVMSHHPIQLHV